jgi:type VI secretion system secreted protein Hcp
MRRRTALATIASITAAATLAFTPSVSLAASSGSGADNARVIGTLTVTGLSGTAIQVRSYSWAMQVPVDDSSGGATGRAQWTDLTVTKSVDAVSPSILLGAARGTRYTNAVLVVYKPGTTETLARYTFTDVLLSGQSSNDLGRNNGFPIESVGLTWRRISVQFGTGAPVCWDRATGAQC